MILDSKDLMVGDWVHSKHHNVNTQITSIESNAVWLRDNSCWERHFMPEVEPIPITAEILKANGFMPDDLCDYAEKYVCPVKIKKIPQTILEFTFYEGISADTLFKCWTKPESCDGENSVHICDLKCVHQLQHALRLCSIDKEIIL